MWPFSSSYPELTASQVGVPLEGKASMGCGHGVYDYIIVGGGTAGCVLASRLSEEPNAKVLLVERGVLNDTWASRVPLISSDFNKDNAPAFKWKTVPQRNANDREFQVVTGKALGGTTRINSMLYTRGAPAEWNAWSQAGRTGWSYNELLPYFVKSERASDQLRGQHHGTAGVWFVRPLDGWAFGCWPRVVKASTALGFPFIEDLNDPSAPILGCAMIHRTQDPGGRRHAVSSAFLPLKLAQDRKAHLKICTGTIATKIDIETGSKLKAAGVHIESEFDESGKTYYARARREVIVCAGTFGSPHLLLLSFSGIGPQAHLQDQGVEQLTDLPGVGQHLMDHVGVPISWKVPLKDSLHAIQTSVLVAILHFLKYLFYGTGFFLLPVSQVALLVRSGLLSPSSQLSASTPQHPSSTSSDLDAHNPANIADLEILPEPLNLSPATLFSTREGIFSFLCILVQPKSTGFVRLGSSDPRARPVTDLGTLSNHDDLTVLRKGLKLALALARTMRAQGWSEMQDHELPSSEEDGVLDDFIRTYAQTEFHYSSTCRMAPQDDLGVVDDELRVYGVEGLRIADASVFPSIVATHTQAPVVVVAEKCADMVKRTYAT